MYHIQKYKDIKQKCKNSREGRAVEVNFRKIQYKFIVQNVERMETNTIYFYFDSNNFKTDILLGMAIIIFLN